MAEQDRNEALFPLPLTSMEKFHWFDSSDEFVNQIFGRFRFEGLIDPQTADHAAKQTIARHPLLNATITDGRNGLAWNWTPDRTPTIDWQGPLNVEGLPRLESESSVPWNVVTRAGNDGTELWFYMSHCIGDGLAGIQIISDWMKIYHSQITGDRIKGQFRLDGDRLRQRNELGIFNWSYLQNLWAQPLGLFGAYKFIFRKSAEVSNENIESGPWKHNQQPCVIGDWIDVESSLKIKSIAQSQNISANSVFVGQLMKTLGRFCEQNNPRHQRWIRLILPMNIRNFGDRRMTATNRATIVQIDRSRDDFERSDYFRQLHREIKVIKDWELGKLFLLAIRLMSWFPPILRNAASSDKSRGTAVVANLGEPFGRSGLPIEEQKMKVGNLRLVDFDFVGPIRHRMPVNFTIQKHLERYRISIHFDPRVMDDMIANELLRSYLTDLSRTA